MPQVTNENKVRILELSQCEISNEAGEKFKFGSLWQQQTGIFVFLRHFACLMCRSHAKEVWRNRDKYLDGGRSQLYFIGNGQPHFIKQFKEDLDLEQANIYTDPSLKSFHASGFNRGFLATLGPRGLTNGLKTMMKGERQGAYEKAAGDLWQLGGILAINPQGKVVYHFMSEVMGDYPPEEEINSTPWLSREK